MHGWPAAVAVSCVRGWLVPPVALALDASARARVQWASRASLSPLLYPRHHGEKYSSASALRARSRSSRPLLLLLLRLRLRLRLRLLPPRLALPRRAD
jgi:hypothetical protein